MVARSTFARTDMDLRSSSVSSIGGFDDYSTRTTHSEDCVMTIAFGAMAVRGLMIPLLSLPVSRSMAESGGREAEPGGDSEYSAVPSTANPMDDVILEHAAKHS
jgi:hypothetical protein